MRIGFLYNGKDNIQLKLGSTVLGAPGGATERLNCIYFKRMVVSKYFVVRVRYLSFEGVANNSKVDVSWSTDIEVNNNHFEIKRSFDGDNFSTIAIVLDAFTTNGSYKRYNMSDNATALAGRSIVYYRLKQVDVKGNFSYSHVVAVRLHANKANSMQALPNPFNENLSLHFTTPANGTGIIRLQSATGQSIVNKKVSISKGDNTVQIGSLGGLSKDVYVAQVVVNGMVVNNQKVIKN